MRSALSLCASSLLTLLTCNGCKSFPILEVCITGDAGLICHDDRLPSGKQDYTRAANNDVCTNVQDYETGLAWAKAHDK